MNTNVLNVNDDDEMIATKILQMSISQLEGLIEVLEIPDPCFTPEDQASMNDMVAVLNRVLASRKLQNRVAYKQD